MDIVYICRPGNNEELRYSIRSVVKNLRHDNLWVVGQKPNWYTGNFIHVPAVATKYTNARRNLERICSGNEISDSFILMNDDFYVMKKIEKLEYFYDGLLLNKAKSNELLSSNNSYTKMLYNTYDKLASYGIHNPLNYELHVPMIMNKSLLKGLLKYKICLWRSLYGNIYDVGGIEMQDVKVHSPTSNKFNGLDYKNQDSLFLSSTDTYFDEFEKFLKGKFNKKSIYESDNLS